jgi:hypothetical protein
MLALFLLSMNVPLGSLAWWPLTLAAMLSVYGVLSWIRTSRAGLGWSNLRKEIFVSSIVLLLACLSFVGLARGILAFRSTMEIEPGEIGFLFNMVVWLGVWYGLDAHFRSSVRKINPLIGYRYQIGLLIAGLIVFIENKLFL